MPNGCHIATSRSSRSEDYAKIIGDFSLIERLIEEDLKQTGAMESLK
jgi:hypothetical protein